MDLLDLIVIVLAVAAAVGGYRLGLLGRLVSWLGLGLGFYVANGPHPGDEGESPFEGCPNGWCGECEKKRLECGGWNDESEAFSGVTLVCVYCFEEIRRRNTTGNEAQ